MITDEVPENQSLDNEAQKHMRKFTTSVCALAKMGLRLGIRYQKKAKNVGVTLTWRPLEGKIKTKKS